MKARARHLAPNSRMPSAAYRAFHIIFSAMMVATLGIVLFIPSFFDVAHEKSFLLPIPALAVVAAAVLIAMLVLVRCEGKLHRVRMRLSVASNPLVRVLSRNWDALVAYLLTLLILVFQFRVACGLVFLGDWDSGILFRHAWELLDQGSYTDFFVSYLETYPNNLSFFALMYQVMTLAYEVFGIRDVSDLHAIFVMVNCILAALASLLVWHSVKRRCGTALGLLSFVLMAVLVMLSPHNLSTYTDTLTLPLVTGMLLLGLYRPTRQFGSVVKFVAMGCMIALGVSLKPQTLFVPIALVMGTCIKGLIEDRVCLKGFLPALQLVTRLACCVLAAGATFALLQVCSAPITAKLGVEEGKSVPISHYVFMGLNQRSDGSWDGEDQFADIYAPGMETTSQRDAVIWPKVGERLRQMGISGMSKHLAKKQAMNWHDGTFGWAEEGDAFTRVVKADVDDSLVSFVWGLVAQSGGAPQEPLYEGGSNARSAVRMGLWFTFVEIAWLAVLIAMTLAVFRKRGQVSTEYLITFASVIALMLFELLFEGRARYLYAYVPVFVLLACGNLAALAARLRGGRETRMGSQLVAATPSWQN